jgi:hypothetical protein
VDTEDIAIAVIIVAWLTIAAVCLAKFRRDQERRATRSTAEWGDDC